LTQGDFGSLLRAFQFDAYNTLKSLSDAPEEMLKEILSQCLKTQPSFTSKEFNAFCDTETGITEGIYLSLRHKHPDIIRDEIRNWKSTDCQIAIQIIVGISTSINVEESQKKILAIAEKFPQHLPTLSGQNSTS